MRSMVGRFVRRTRRVAYENPWITVWHDEVTRPDGKPGIYGVVHFANRAVGVVAIDDQDRVVLVGQHRYTMDHDSWEIPEGGVPADEEPIVGAQRELREETGLTATTWTELCRLELSNSVTDETAVVLVASGLTHGQADPEPTESLRVEAVAFDEAIAMTRDGRIVDVLSVVALQRLALDRIRAQAGASTASRSDVTDPFAADADALPALDVPTIAGLLAASGTTIAAEVDGLGAAAGWRPAPGEWSANECVGHLIEAERRGFAGRIRRIVDAAHGEHPDLPPDLEAWDPPAVAAARRDHVREPRELVEEFLALRADGIALVRTLTEDDLARSGMHPDVGPLRVDELLGEWVHHDRNHVRQLLAVTQARVWGQMGNARRFSLEDL